MSKNTDFKNEINPKIEYAMERVFPRCGEPKDWANALSTVLPEHGIDTQDRILAFMAQCGHESAEWTSFSENLNYSERALKTVFGKYFRNTSLNPENYARKPEKIANVVYAGRMGNGPTNSGDGWKYRGRGPIQLTGKNNYEAFSLEFGVDAVDNPEIVARDKKVSILSAVWFWNSNDLNEYADKKDIKGMTRVINGGYNGLQHRKYLFERCSLAMEVYECSLENHDEDEEFSTVLRKGDTGLGVEMLQGVLGIKADGIFGPGTEKAVREWQERHGLLADGIVGPDTMLELFC